MDKTLKELNDKLGELDRRLDRLYAQVEKVEDEIAICMDTIERRQEELRKERVEWIAQSSKHNLRNMKGRGEKRS